MRLIDQLSDSKVKAFHHRGSTQTAAVCTCRLVRAMRGHRYMLNGKSRDMGLGSLHDLNLKQARTRVGEFRALRAKGVDPIEAREKFRTEAKLAADRSMTFKQCAEAYIAAYKVIELL